MDDAPREELSPLEQRLGARTSIPPFTFPSPEQERPDVPWSRREAWIAFGAVFVGMSIASGIALYLDKHHREINLLWSFLELQVLTIGLPWFLAIRRRGARVRDFGFRSFKERYLAAPFVILLLMGVVGLVYASILRGFGIGPHGGAPAWSPDFTDAFRRYNHAVLFIAFVFVSPFVEELFTRGFLLQGFARSHGWRIGGAISSLMWALMHPPLAIVPIFLLGLMLASLYRRCRSLWPCVFTHMVINALAVGGQLTGVTTKH